MVSIDVQIFDVQPSVADTREHCLPPIDPLLGAQGTYVALALRICQVCRLSDVGYVIG